jgi:hypothetical protein
MKFQYLDPNLVAHLRKKLPAKEYQENQTMTPEAFLAESAYRAGQRDVIKRLEKILKDQE